MLSIKNRSFFFLTIGAQSARIQIMKTIYVAGGFYSQEGIKAKEFRLVRSAISALPYVSTEENGSLRNQTKHHANFYRIEGVYAVEVAKSELTDVHGDSKVGLSREEIAEILKQVIQGISGRLGFGCN